MKKKLLAILLTVCMVLSMAPAALAADSVFTDVKADDWYADEIKWVYDEGLMDGVGGDNFAPETTTTRAMLVTILWRLEGSPIENKNGVDIISDGIAYGSVQIPASGTPIIMMADRQTTGGYAKIATVITADLYKIAQAKPGSYIRFQAVTEKEAVAALKEERSFLKQLQYQTYFAK